MRLNFLASVFLCLGLISSPALADIHGALALADIERGAKILRNVQAATRSNRVAKRRSDQTSMASLVHRSPPGKISNIRKR